MDERGWSQDRSFLVCNPNATKRHLRRVWSISVDCDCLAIANTTWLICRAPVMKWGVVLTGASDFVRPADKLSLTQNLALMATGSIWSRCAQIDAIGQAMIASAHRPSSRTACGHVAVLLSRASAPSRARPSCARGPPGGLRQGRRSRVLGLVVSGRRRRLGRARSVGWG